MNERIKELLQESYSHFGHGKYRTPELVAEKFAELMVREFIKVAGTEMGYSEYVAMRTKIEKHFGVEE